MPSGQDYEDWVFTAFPTSSQIDWDTLANTYRDLSAQVISTHLSSGSTGKLETKNSEANHIIWALIYGYRTYFLTSRLLQQFGITPNSLAEFGSGVGPGGLAASQLGTKRVTLLDHSREKLQQSARIYAASGSSSPQIQVADLRTETYSGTPVNMALFSFSLAELSRSIPGNPMRNSLALLSNALEKVSEEGHLLILEAGTKSGAHFVQDLRDNLPGGLEIVGPCASQPKCPMDEPDWCHFTWPISPGSATSRIAARAKRNLDRVHSSWLLIKKTKTKSASKHWRLLEKRPAGKAKIQARCCTPDGLITLTTLKRNKTHYKWWDEVEVGAALRSESSLEKKGDGFRVEPNSKILVLDEHSSPQNKAPT